LKRLALAALLSLAALPGRADDRSTEILRYECRTDVARRETTLFANGTVRMRRGRIGDEWMGLAELAPDKLQGFLNRLEGEDLSQIKSPDPGPEGSWIERCELRLQLPGKDLQAYRFGQYDPLPLALSHVVRIAQELEKKVPVVKDRDDLPAGYEPRRGDVLKHVGDGNRFRVTGFTSDGKGLELEGIDQPIELYVPRDQVRKKFTELLSREP
jgi:hypothetical protein